MHWWRGCGATFKVDKEGDGHPCGKMEKELSLAELEGGEDIATPPFFIVTPADVTASQYSKERSGNSSEMRVSLPLPCAHG